MVHNFYPRSPCGERQQAQGLKIPPLRISIHALLAESDSRPRALKSRRCVFLSTLSLRRATISANNHVRVRQNFYPRSPCGERPKPIPAVTRVANFYPRSPCGERPQVFQRIAKPFRISIHALLAESDPAKSESLTTYLISIHALLAESDAGHYRKRRADDDFYPRSPCGERLPAAVF